MSKNIFLNKTIAVTPIDITVVEEEHMENKEYVCANPLAIYGYQPRSVEECLNNFFAGWTIGGGETLQMVAKLRPSEKTASGVDGQGNPTGLDFWEEIPEPGGCTLTCAFVKTKFCDELSKKLDDSYLGCFYHEPNSPFSCNCPYIGKNFHKILTVALKHSTFWNTPYETPLMRKAFMAFLNSIKVEINVEGNFNLKPGKKVFIIDTQNPQFSKRLGKLHGDWFIVSASHRIFKDRHFETTLVLSRVFVDANSQFYSTTVSDISILGTIQK